MRINLRAKNGVDGEMYVLGVAMVDELFSWIDEMGAFNEDVVK